jgi:hypothetical protein
MLDRRKFLKILGFAGLAFSFLPTLFMRKSVALSLNDTGAVPKVKNWLYGSSRKGCSTSRVAMDYHGSLEDGLDDFLNFRIPTEFK